MGELLTDQMVGTLSEYNDLLYRIFRGWQAEMGNDSSPQVWFRGQDRDDPLLPKVLRNVTDPNTGYESNFNEYYIHQAFSSLYRNYTSERFRDWSSEYYSFMQHYGIPTRLLDWTENGALALYFAVSGGQYDQPTQRVVWVMNPGAINRLTTGRIDSNGPLLSTVPLVQTRLRIPGSLRDGVVSDRFIDEQQLADDREAAIQLLRFPIAFWPVSSGNIRIAAQKGCFTIHGTDRRPVEAFFDDLENRRYLVKIKIQKESVALLREQLRLMGVTPMSVYPDLFGVSDELSSSRYMVRRNE
jgi:hypothetical protein